jgi:hypothetical protein
MARQRLSKVEFGYCALGVVRWDNADSSSSYWYVAEITSAVNDAVACSFVEDLKLAYFPLL